ncbi:MAG: TIGR04255 family protein [Bdellovibrionota bacterium]
MSVSIQSIHFNKPPLNEVVFGVWISNIQWDVTQYGKFHSVIAEHYPKIMMQNPIPPPGDLGMPSVPGVQFLSLPELPRVMYEGKDPAFLLQLQPDRLLINWRKHPNSKTEYPHFIELQKRLLTEFNLFADFCKKSNIGNPIIGGFDLTYVNHLLHKADWTNAEDLGKYFSHLEWLNKFPSAKVFSLDLAYPVEDFLVRTNVKKGILIQQRQDLFMIEIGISKAGVNLDLLEKTTAQANEILVKEFMKLSTATAHKEWELANE